MACTNSIVIFSVVDLDECNKENVCKGWIGGFKGPTEEPTEVKNFVNCLIEKLNTNVQNFPVRTIFRIYSFFQLSNFLNPVLGFIRGVSTLWEPLQLKECAENSNLKIFFSTNPTSQVGYPVLIFYKDKNEIHHGRLIVEVIKWL